MRARAIATVFALGVVVLGDVLVWGDRLGSDGLRAGVGQALLGVLAVLLVPVAQRLWGRGLRRQTAHLDELLALEIVAGRMANAAAKDPSHVPWALFFLHRAYRDLLPRDGTPDTFEWPEFFPMRLDRRRRWAAMFDSYDPARDVCYYWVQIFDGKRRTAAFIAEIAADFRVREPGDRRKEALKRLAPIAATGKSNTSYVGAITAGP